MSDFYPPEELTGATDFRDRLRAFNEKLAAGDPRRASDLQTLRDLERDLEARRTRYLLAAWKLREARHLFETAQREVSSITAQYRPLQTEVTTLMEQAESDEGDAATPPDDVPAPVAVRCPASWHRWNRVIERLLPPPKQATRRG